MIEIIGEIDVDNCIRLALIGIYLHGSDDLSFTRVSNESP